ncbi:hypothetical protein FRC14_007270 [Serendipita sp. 396]|nr:hypothetical protein FRC14_007270 [Serendipita sp. 396]
MRIPLIHNLEGPQFDVKLPPELWGIIIDFVLDEVRHPYRYCTPATFLEYQSRFALTGKLENDTTLDNWKHIRLVCRTWTGLAGSQPHVNIKRVALGITNASTQSVRIFSIRNETAAPGFERPGLIVLRRTLNTPGSVFPAWNGASSITIHKEVGKQPQIRAFLLRPEMNSLTTIILGDGYYQWGLGTLLENPSSFRNVRCLSLPIVNGDSSFWEDLQDGYPQLVSLTIRQYTGGAIGRYTFENLEILDVSLWKSFRLSCPSLKHLTVRHGSPEHVMELLMDHGNQLESLILGGSVASAVAAHSGNVWAMIPNVRTFGRLVKAPFPVPPVGHPLQHLRLLSHRHPVDIGYVLKELESHPGITHIHIESKFFKSGNTKLLRARCLAHNVEIIGTLNESPLSVTSPPYYEVWLINVLVTLYFLRFLVSYPFRKPSQTRYLYYY